jgi:hypothetical protein
MPHLIDTTKDEALNPASLACIDLLMQVLADAKAGKVTSVAIVACGPSDFGANMAGPNAMGMNMGIDVLKAKIIAAVSSPAAPQSPILRSRPVGPRR